MGESGSVVRKRQKLELLNLIGIMPMADVRKVAGVYSLKTGLRTATVISMIEELKDADLVEISEGKIKPSGFPSKEEITTKGQGVEEHGDKV